MDTSRLSRCGWDSFRTELFLGEPGRQGRNVGPQFLAIARDFCRGQSVLELCSGAGRLCIELARAGHDVTGIDLDERMLRTARWALAQESADPTLHHRACPGGEMIDSYMAANRMMSPERRRSANTEGMHDGATIHQARPRLPQVQGTSDSAGLRVFAGSPAR